MSDQLIGYAIAVSVLAVFIGLQMLAHKRMPESLLVWFPSVIVGMTAILSAIFAIGGSNLWPLALMFVVPLCGAALIVLIVAGSIATKRND